MIISKHKNWLFIILLVASSLFATKSLWHPGLFTSHDGPHKAVRLAYYLEALKDGQFPPRYVLPALHSFGYPLFVFSYNLPWLLAAPFNLIGLSIYDCIKLVFIITFISSGLTMFWWQRQMWGSAFAGFVGSFLYLWAPYRFLDIYVRGSLGEAMTFMFLPLVFYGLQGQTLQKARSVLKKKIILGAIGITGVVLSHSLIFLLFIPAILVWWLVNLLLESTNHVQKLISDLIIVFLGIGLSGFYLVPAILLKKYTVFDKVMAGTSSSFADHFPRFWQLLYSPWGYGFSFFGVAQDAMSFQVGIAQWMTIGLSLLIVVWGIRKLIRPQGLSLQSGTQKVWLALTFIFIFAFSLFMMQPVSTSVWKLVNRFAYIDYPWRYLFLSVFAASVLGGFCVASVKSLKLPKALKSLKPAIWLGVFLVAVALYTNRNHIRVNAWLDWPPQVFVGDGDTSNAYDEYAPVRTDKNYMERTKELVQVLQGQGQQSNIVKKTSQISFRVENKQASLYRVNVWYFPQVKVLIDGKSAEYTYKDKGVLDFWVSEGKHQVKIDYIRTVIEKAGLLLSLTSVVILIYHVCRKTFANCAHLKI